MAETKRTTAGSLRRRSYSDRMSTPRSSSTRHGTLENRCSLGVVHLRTAGPDGSRQGGSVPRWVSVIERHSPPADLAKLLAVHPETIRRAAVPPRRLLLPARCVMTAAETTERPSGSLRRLFPVRGYVSSVRPLLARISGRGSRASGPSAGASNSSAAARPVVRSVSPRRLSPAVRSRCSARSRRVLP